MDALFWTCINRSSVKSVCTKQPWTRHPNTVCCAISSNWRRQFLSFCKNLLYYCSGWESSCLWVQGHPITRHNVDRWNLSGEQLAAVFEVLSCRHNLIEVTHVQVRRDPDQYEFHIMTLPPTFIQPPHATMTWDYPIEHGRRVEGNIDKKMLQHVVIYNRPHGWLEWSQPYSTEQYATLLSRLYSPV